MKPTHNSQDTKQSIPQNPISRGKIYIQRFGTALILLSSILPFANNLIRRFYNTNSIILENVAGVRPLDLDDVIFFLSMPIAFAFVAIGALCKAHKLSYYAVFLSCYFQFRFLLIFIFKDKNVNYENAQIALIFIFISIVLIIYLVEKYFIKIKILEKFNNKTIERFSKILNKHNHIDEKN